MSKYSERERHFDFMGWVKTLPCAVPAGPWPLALTGPCEGVTEADHVAPKGTGMKGTDLAACNLCVRHHRSPGIEHLLYGKVPKGSVRAWKREVAAANLKTWEAM